MLSILGFSGTLFPGYVLHWSIICSSINPFTPSYYTAAKSHFYCQINNNKNISLKGLIFTDFKVFCM